ncbi:unnamed protein product [Urochloa humidicola]
MADDDEGELPMYIEDEEEAAAAAKAAAEREKRREEGPRWWPEKIMEKAMERHNAWMREYCVSKYPPTPRVDPEEESPVPPMRHLLSLGRGGPQLASSVNILSVRVVRSAIGYPIHLYGTIFVRDELDRKRVCVFRRDRHNCQRIASKDESLSLTGPYRGLLVFSNIYFEIDLKSKEDHGEAGNNDTELGKWCIKDSAVASTSKPITNRFVGKLCAIDLTYAPAHRAVEVAFQFKICEIFTVTERRNGSTAIEWLPFNKKRSKEHSAFHGNITISINGIHQDIVLYDSQAAGIDVDDDGGVLKLSRHVFAVPIDREVSLKIAPHEGRHFELATFPRICGGSSSTNVVGPYKLEVKLVWSALFSPREDGMYASWRDGPLQSC